MAKIKIKEGQKIPKEIRDEIKKAASMPITYDDDCPELTDAQLKEFAAVAQQQRDERKKQVLSIRVSPETLRAAKALGKGYTGILGRLLDEAVKDPELIKKAL